MTRPWWVVLAVLLVALDVYLVGWRWSDVAGNIEAQFVIVTPAFVAHHVLMRRHADRLHAQRLEEDHARHLEQRHLLAAVREQVGELHDFHVRGKLPDRELRPWLYDDPDAETTA